MSTPDRVTFSIPPGFEIDADTLDQLVERSEYESRSEFIREAIREAANTS